MKAYRIFPMPSLFWLLVLLIIVANSNLFASPNYSWMFASNNNFWEKVCNEKRKMFLETLKDEKSSTEELIHKAQLWTRNVPDSYKKEFWNDSVREKVIELLNRLIDKDFYYLPRSETPDLACFELMQQARNSCGEKFYKKELALIWNSLAFHWNLFPLIDDFQNFSEKEYKRLRCFFIARTLEKDYSDDRLGIFLDDFTHYLEEFDDQISLNLSKGALIHLFNFELVKKSLGAVSEVLEERFMKLRSVASKLNDKELIFLVSSLEFRRRMSSFERISDKIYEDYKSSFNDLKIGSIKDRFYQKVYIRNEQIWRSNRGIFSFLYSLIPPPPRWWFEARTYLLAIFLIVSIIFSLNALRKFNLEKDKFSNLTIKLEKQKLGSDFFDDARLVFEPIKSLPDSHENLDRAVEFKSNLIVLGTETSPIKIMGAGIKPEHLKIIFDIDSWFIEPVNGITVDTSRNSIKSRISLANEQNLFLLGDNETPLSISPLINDGRAIAIEINGKKHCVKPEVKND